jgi:Ca2+-binding RTX toxin-like protein
VSLRKVLVVVTLVGASSLVAVQAASAATTRIVGSCPGATYTSIQTAVNAANPGDTIKLCPGTFTEQVTTTTNLTFVGAGIGSSIIQAPATIAASPCLAGQTTIFDICGGATVSMSNLTVAGPGPSGCGSLGYGIFVTGNASLSISNASVAHVRDAPLSGCQNGTGIRAGYALSSSVGHLTMTNVTISDYQKNAVVVSSIGSTGNIQSSTTTGAGPQTMIAQNGIQISSGATGTVANNTVTANECNHVSCGPDPIADTQSAGVLLFFPGPGTTVTGNHVTSNDIGIYNALDDATYGAGVTPISSNVVTSSRFEGIFEDQGTSTITGNTVTGGASAGVIVVSYSGNTQDSVTKVKGNAISGTGVGVLIENQSGTTFNATAVVKKNQITGNLKGAVNTTDKQVKFTKNWWGAASGPSDWAVGNGDTVSNDVTFFPWSRNTAYTVLATCSLTGPPGGNSTLNGTPGNDIICAQAGNNVLVGNGGKDLLIGGPGGNDHLIAGNGPTTMIGNGGVDVLSGGSGRDSEEASAGSTCLPGSGAGSQSDCNNP